MSRSDQTWKHFALVFGGLGGIIAVSVYFAVLKERTEEIPPPIHVRASPSQGLDLDGNGRVDETDAAAFIRQHLNKARQENSAAENPTPTTAPPRPSRPELDTEELIAKINDRANRDIRSPILEFGRAAPANTEGIPALSEVVEDESVDIDTRVLAAWALGRYQGKAADALPALESLLEHPDLRVTPNAGEASELIVETRVSTLQAAIQMIRGATKNQ